jgi:outer membrane protein OmpA-like peptidoglycan-associated protein
VGAIDDPLEREADRAAERVVQSLDERDGGAGTRVEGVSAGSSKHAERPPAGPPRSGVSVLGTPGVPLDASIAGAMGVRFGVDFSGVRIHDGPAAANAAQGLRARAFTAGQDVVFGKHEYSPSSDSGRRLIAHELAHVVQQARMAPGAGAGSPATRIQRAPIPGSAPEPLHDDELTPEAASSKGSTTVDAFAFGSPELTDDHKKRLAEHAATLKRLLGSYPDSFISVVGFTDAVGTEANNLTLGKQRADAVVAELVANGVANQTMRASSLGKEFLKVNSPNPEPLNRRVEISLTARSFFAQTTAPKAPAPALGPVNVPSVSNIPGVPNVSGTASLPGPGTLPALGPRAPVSTGPRKVVPPDIAKEIKDLSDLIAVTADNVKRDPLVRALRNAVVKAQPFLDDDTAKKALDDAIVSGTTQAINEALKAVLSAVTGKPFPSGPPNLPPTGPNVQEKDLNTRVFNLPPVNIDTPAPVRTYSFKLDKVKPSYKPGEWIDVYVTAPTGFTNTLPAVAHVIVADPKNLQDQGSQATRLADVSVAFEGTQKRSLQAPTKAGKYVLAVVVGFAVRSEATQEFTVAP